MSDEKIVEYPGKAIDVRFDGRLCMGVGECGRSEGPLFEGGREPWCVPDGVDVADVREIVERCPSGALTYVDKSGTPEQAPAVNSCAVAPDGPLYFTGDLAIEGAPEDMPGLSFRAALCRCGASKNKPFCDNSHVEAGFKDTGAVGQKGPGLEHEGGELTISPRPDGPLLVTGNLTLRAGAGRVAWQGTRVPLCRCGASKNKPFCDGTHKEIGFKSGD
jgi:CDGSH-type Zn-finger protein/uncharacterized Fe-S cluster protein YjdI